MKVRVCFGIEKLSRVKSSSVTVAHASLVTFTFSASFKRLGSMKQERERKSKRCKKIKL